MVHRGAGWWLPRQLRQIVELLIVVEVFMAAAAVVAGGRHRGGSVAAGGGGGLANCATGQEGELSANEEADRPSAH